MLTIGRSNRGQPGVALRPVCILGVPQSGRTALGDVPDPGGGCHDGRKPLPARSQGRYPSSGTGMRPVHLGNIRRSTYLSENGEILKIHPITPQRPSTRRSTRISGTRPCDMGRVRDPVAPRTNAPLRVSLRFRWRPTTSGRSTSASGNRDSQQALRDHLTAYMRAWKTHPTPFAWTKPAQAIIRSHRRMLERISTAVH
jgi:hypothetical protein